MGNIGGLQLLPVEKKKFRVPSLGGNNFLLSVSLFAILIFSVAYFFLNWYIVRKNDAIAQVDLELSAIYLMRDGKMEEKLLNFEKQMNAAKKLLGSHTAWSGGFRSLQDLIDPRITLSSLDADAAKRTYMFNATADSYATVAKQIASFYGSDLISNVYLPQISVSENGSVDFTMELTFKPDHFLFIK